MQAEVKQHLFVVVVVCFAERMNGHAMVLCIAEKELPFSDWVVGARTGAKARDIGRLYAQPHSVGYAGLTAGPGGALCVVFVELLAARRRWRVAGDGPGASSIALELG